MYAPRTGVASRAVPAEKVGCSGVLTLGKAGPCIMSFTCSGWATPLRQTLHAKWSCGRSAG